MALKFFVLIGLLTIFRGGVVGASQPAIAAASFARVSEDTYDPLPQYTFGYNVEDAITGDSKSQIESRNGGVVLGQYSLNDPDGTRRIVDYASDPINGFNVIVRKAPLAVTTPFVGPAVEPVARTAPRPVVANTAVRLDLEPVAVRSAARSSVEPDVRSGLEHTAARAASSPKTVRVASASSSSTKTAQESTFQAKSVQETTASVRTAPAATPLVRHTEAKSVLLGQASAATPVLTYSGLLAPLAYRSW